MTESRTGTTGQDPSTTAPTTGEPGTTSTSPTTSTDGTGTDATTGDATTIHGEQVALRHTHEGLGSDEYKERVTFLREPDFFATCAGGTATEVHECLVQGLTDECATQLECPR